LADVAETDVDVVALPAESLEFGTQSVVQLAVVD
jgi:hypothetical protein